MLFLWTLEKVGFVWYICLVNFRDSFSGAPMSSTAKGNTMKCHEASKKSLQSFKGVL